VRVRIREHAARHDRERLVQRQRGLEDEVRRLVGVHRDERGRRANGVRDGRSRIVVRRLRGFFFVEPRRRRENVYPFERGADVTHGRAVEKSTADFNVVSSRHFSVFLKARFVRAFIFIFTKKDVFGKGFPSPLAHASLCLFV
jgi:hypothetical protein